MALVPSLDITKPKIEGPMTIPLKISPITEGQQICSKSSPIKSAATSIIRISEIIEKAKTTPQNSLKIDTVLAILLLLNLLFYLVDTES
jgi:hypothetical protein